MYNNVKNLRIAESSIDESKLVEVDGKSSKREEPKPRLISDFKAEYMPSGDYRITLPTSKVKASDVMKLKGVEATGNKTILFKRWVDGMITYTLQAWVTPKHLLEYEQAERQRLRDEELERIRKDNEELKEKGKMFDVLSSNPEFAKIMADYMKAQMQDLKESQAI